MSNMPVPITPSDSTMKKFWGLWLPLPTVIAVINSLFWTWVIFRAVGNTELPIEKSLEPIIQQF